MGRWCNKGKFVILFYLTDEGTKRFLELHRKIRGGVSERILTHQFRELEWDGIVHREVYPEVPSKLKYSLIMFG